MLAFDAWLPVVTPWWTWDWSYLRLIQAKLDQVTAGSVRKLMLFMPPRHGKSELTTVRYPVWRLERDPAMRVIVGAYNQTLADKFSRKSRRIALQRFSLSQERTAVEDWETTRGGGLRAVGVGGGITGQGGDLIIIDDPVKSREEANSPAYRERVWDWYTQDLYTRLEPGGSIILIMTRWHEDDLAGRILASEDGPNWEILSLPALAEPGDPLGRALGEALCPSRFTAEDLAKIRTVLGTWAFTALYQQRPLPEGGGLFKREWFKIVDAAPANAKRVRYWDKAGTAGDGDFSAGVKMAAAPDGQFYVEDVLRGQWSSLKRNRVMRQTAELDGKEVVVWVEQEPGSGGKESAEASIINLVGFNIHAETVTGNKSVRAGPLAAQAEADNVKLVRGAWNAPYLDELCVFPNGNNDDQVDGSSGAFNKLALTSPRVAAAKPTVTTTADLGL
jgi:predicted phage terminase large subunit-like protein